LLASLESLLLKAQLEECFCYHSLRINRKTTQSISASSPEEIEMKKQGKFPPGWDEERVKRVLEHYESQSEDEAVAEDEAAYEDPGQTLMEIPNELVPAVRELLAKKGV